jgi:hypothetical protein
MAHTKYFNHPLPFPLVSLPPIHLFLRPPLAPRRRIPGGAPARRGGAPLHAYAPYSDAASVDLYRRLVHDLRMEDPRLAPRREAGAGGAR